MQSTLTTEQAPAGGVRHLDHESLMVLPDFARYRDLGVRTCTGRRAANFHLVLLAIEGGYSNGSWTS